MQPWLAAALVGFVAGLHSSIWGMYKDAPHEGFTWSTFFRSMFFGAVLGVAIQQVTGLYPADAASFVVFFGVVYVVERAVAEAYKTFFRQQDQSKYTIPMQFAVFGKPVTSRGLRALLGVGYVGIMVLTLWLVWLLDRAIDGPPSWWLVFLVATSPAVASAPDQTENCSGSDHLISPLTLSQAMKLPIPPWLSGAGYIDRVAPT